MAETNGTDLSTPITSVEVIKDVMSIAIKNRELIDVKKRKSSAIIATVKAKIKVIVDDKQDKYINDLIVICNDNISEMESLRKAYTKRVNDWLKDEIAPENALKVEVASLVAMRNDRARRITAENEKKNAAINAEKIKQLAEAEVKGMMKESFETGLIKKIQAFETSIESYFMQNLKESNGPAVEKAFRGLKPSLKEDFYLSLFDVGYDVNKMTQDHYDDLIKRAKGYWTYEAINTKYVEEANAIVAKWIEKIPQRIKELGLIASGDERVKKIVEERDANLKAESAKEVEQKIAQIKTTVANEVQGEQMSASFQAQAQEQNLTPAAGTRNKRIFLIENPGDTLTLSKIIGSIIIHTIPNLSAAQKIKMVIEHDKDGKMNLDKDGDPIYTPGVKYWLDTAATLSYKPEIKGLKEKIKVTTIAKK